MNPITDKTDVETPSLIELELSFGVKAYLTTKEHMVWRKMLYNELERDILKDFLASTRVDAIQKTICSLPLNGDEITVRLRELELAKRVLTNLRRTIFDFASSWVTQTIKERKS